MRAKFKKNLYRRKNYYRIEKYILIGRILLKTSILSTYKKFILQAYLNKILKFENINKIENRCFISNNPRSISSYFRLSRMNTKSMIGMQKLNGFTKASW